MSKQLVSGRAKKKRLSKQRTALEYEGYSIKVKYSLTDKGTYKKVCSVQTERSLLKWN